MVATELGRIGGLICWENYMPLARFHLYAQGIEIWLAPTLATGDAWIATMRHIAREGRVCVVGVNPCVRADQIPADFPQRERVWRAPDPTEPDWVEPGNTVICDPSGNVVAGPLRHEEGILTAAIDLRRVHEAEARARRGQEAMKVPICWVRGIVGASMPLEISGVAEILPNNQQSGA